SAAGAGAGRPAGGFSLVGQAFTGNASAPALTGRAAAPAAPGRSPRKPTQDVLDEANRGDGAAGHAAVRGQRPSPVFVPARLRAGAAGRGPGPELQHLRRRGPDPAGTVVPVLALRSPLPTAPTPGHLAAGAQLHDAAPADGAAHTVDAAGP